MLKPFEFFEFLHAPNFVWAFLIIEDYLVYPCRRIAFLVLILAPSVRCEEKKLNSKV